MNSTYTIVGKCANGHTQNIFLHNFSEQAAREYAALLNGTHSMYIYSPRDPRYNDPTHGPSTIAHCSTCNSLVDCRVLDPDGKEI